MVAAKIIAGKNSPRFYFCETYTCIKYANETILFRLQLFQFQIYSGIDLMRCIFTLH